MNASIQAAVAPLRSRDAGPSSHRVLLVDDDAGFRSFCERYLSRNAYRVSAVSSGRDAFAQCRRFRPDVIVLDWFLANGPTGEQTVRALKSGRDTCGIPVIVMSGLARPDVRREALSAGADVFLAKMEFTRDLASRTLLNRIDELRRRPPVRCGRILVIDGDLKSRAFIERVLSRERHELHFARTGARAVELTQDHALDAVLLGLGSPELDGIQAYRLLRSQARGRSVPVVFMSTENGELLRSAALALGANGFLPKPFGENELLAAVSRALAVEPPAPEPAPLRLVALGRLRVDLASGRVWAHGKPRRLGPQRFALLRALLSHPEGADRHTLLDEAWGQTGDLNLLAKTVQRLKKDVGLDDAIVFHAGSYRLVG